MSNESVAREAVEQVLAFWRQSSEYSCDVVKSRTRPAHGDVEVQVRWYKTTAERPIPLRIATTYMYVGEPEPEPVEEPVVEEAEAGEAEEGEKGEQGEDESQIRKQTVLKITIHKATNLRDMTTDGMNPVVSVGCLGKEQTTKVCENGCSDPSWDETFEFVVGNGGVEHVDPEVGILLSAYDSDPIGLDFVGHHKLTIGGLLESEGPLTLPVYQDNAFSRAHGSFQVSGEVVEVEVSEGDGELQGGVSNKKVIELSSEDKTKISFTLNAAHGLRDFTSDGMDSFARVLIAGEQLQTYTCVRGGPDPVYASTLEAQVNTPYSEASLLPVIIQIFDDDKGLHDFVGHCKTTVAELLTGKADGFVSLPVFEDSQFQRQKGTIDVCASIATPKPRKRVSETQRGAKTQTQKQRRPVIKRAPSTLPAELQSVFSTCRVGLRVEHQNSVWMLSDGPALRRPSTGFSFDVNNNIGR